MLGIHWLSLWSLYTVVQAHARGWLVGAWWSAECFKDVCYGWRLATILSAVLLLLALAVYTQTSVIRFVCSDSQYDPTSAFEDQLLCVNVAAGMNEYNVDVPTTVLCHLRLKLTLNIIQSPPSLEFDIIP